MKAAVVVGVAESSAQPVASAPQVQRLVEAAGAASDAQVRLRVAAEVRPAASARQPGAVAEAAVSAAEVLPPEVAEAVPGAEAVQPRAAVEAARDGVAAPQRVAAAAVLPDGEVLPPEAGRRASARRPAGRPSWRREGHPRPWLARRRGARSAPATRRS
jgi:hypothetical protein